MTDLRPLIAAAAEAATDPDRSAEGYWDAVSALWKHPEVDVLEAVYDWAASRDPALRELVPDVLRALGGKLPFREETLRLFAAMLEREANPEVIAAIGFANADLEDPEMAKLFEPFIAHPDPSVREASVQAMAHAPGEEVAAYLITLTRDPVEDVRSWATFCLTGLASAAGEGAAFDGKAMRAALWERTQDSSEEVRAEAVLGLALREDAGSAALIQAALEGNGPELSQYVEAAALLGAPALHSDLVRLLEMGWAREDGELQELLEQAISATKA